MIKINCKFMVIHFRNYKKKFFNINFIKHIILWFILWITFFCITFKKAGHDMFRYLRIGFLNVRVYSTSSRIQFFMIFQVYLVEYLNRNLNEQKSRFKNEISWNVFSWFNIILIICTYTASSILFRLWHQICFIFII